MPTEIERKFLVKDLSAALGATDGGTVMRQGYLSVEPARTVRVRRAGGRGFVTFKGLSRGASRPEYEYEVPPNEADAMLDELALRPLVEKVRHRIDHGSLTWEVDVFSGDNDGLVVAEVELPSEDFPVALPPWVGEEVTDDPRYLNANLVARPFRTWSGGAGPAAARDSGSAAHDDAGLPDHVRRNRAYWDAQAPAWVEPGHRNWAAAEPSWGIWGIPEAELKALPDVAGLDVIELGCGTAYFSAWLARRGARVVGIDNSAAQLATARLFQAEFGLAFPMIHGNAEEVPLPDATFDMAISEYGASIWADPYRWVPEAARLLRPGGYLVFLVSGTLLMLTAPDEDNVPSGDRLLRPYFGMHRFEWPGEDSVEFHLNPGDRIRLLRANGFEVENLVEIRAPEGATTRFPFVTPGWARCWPSEEIWVARKRS
jgi:CYTH domain-containing protein/SAM-dependent methyltransferase